MLCSAVGWPDVAIALVAGVPGIIAAIFAGLARNEVKTQNGHTLANSVEQTHAMVVRTLGERKGDRLAGGATHIPGERASDE